MTSLSEVFVCSLMYAYRQPVPPVGVDTGFEPGVGVSSSAGVSIAAPVGEALDFPPVPAEHPVTATASTTIIGLTIFIPTW